MLVLTRKRQESVDIGGGISIKVLEIRGNHVKLGIEAPEGVPIHRHEVTERIAADASGSSD